MVKEKRNRGELRRKNWWEPYTWGRTGIGMSKPFDKDWAKVYSVHRRKLYSAKVYGAENNDTFLPLSLVLEFHKFYLTFDRALHNPGNMSIINMETMEERKIHRWPYLTVQKKLKNEDPNPVDNDFPYGNTLEKVIEEYEGATVSKLMVGGNYTLAVGKLVSEAVILLNINKYLKVRVASLEKESISKIFGDVAFENFYSLAVVGGPVK